MRRKVAMMSSWFSFNFLNCLRFATSCISCTKDIGSDTGDDFMTTGAVVTVVGAIIETGFDVVTAVIFASASASALASAAFATGVADMTAMFATGVAA
jgi:uncharacterized protein (DUF983 family)